MEVQCLYVSLPERGEEDPLPQVSASHVSAGRSHGDQDGNRHQWGYWLPWCPQWGKATLFECTLTAGHQRSPAACGHLQLTFLCMQTHDNQSHYCPFWKNLLLHWFPLLTADLPSVSGAPSPHALHHLRPGERQQRRELQQEPLVEDRETAALAIRPGETLIMSLVRQCDRDLWCRNTKETPCFKLDDLHKIEHLLSIDWLHHCLQTRHSVISQSNFLCL